MKTNNYAAIDIGGTNSRIAIFSDNQIIFKKSFKTNINEPKDTLNLLCDVLNKYKVDILGICIPGQADYKTGKILLAPNLPGWLNFGFREFIHDKAKVDKIIFQNDANAMAYAIHKYYKKTKDDITQFFTISTGLGAGLIINNEIFSGACGRAQEIAYIPTAYNDQEENHLSKGSVEYFASGSGIVKRVFRATNKELSTKEIFEAYKKNNEYAQIIKDGIEALGNTISVSMALINPNVIAFGGSVAEFNDWYVQAAIEHAKSVTYKDQFNDAEFLKNPYGDDLTLYGIYFYSKDKLEK